MRDEADAIVVGSGINGLVSAAELAQAGWSVILLERNAEIGGFIATEERRPPPPPRLWVNHIDWRFRGLLCQANGPFEVALPAAFPALIATPALCLPWRQAPKRKAVCFAL